MGLYIKDNIVALATPRGIGALALIRVSGQNLSSLFEKLTSIKKPTPRYAYYSKIKSKTGGVLDNVIITFFKGPKSFTGEDILEISCHGGQAISELLINEIISLGCRLALPGEFSKRAYLNRKIDLTQAESIGFLTGASAPIEAQSGIMAFEGETKKSINNIKELLNGLLLIIEHELDFTEDEINYTRQSEIRKNLQETITLLQGLVSGGRSINKISKGFRVCIVGKPNAGKSTLFNKILGYDKVVVSSEKGTTRDSVEAQIELNNNLFTLIDTAGYWKGKDRLDRLGIKKTKEEVEKSDIVVVLDEKNPKDFAKNIKNINKKICIYVTSKSDLNKIKQKNASEIKISSIKGRGIDRLLTSLSTVVKNNFIAENSYITSNRQIVLLEGALLIIKKAHDNLEFVDMAQLSSLLREALDRLEDIIGRVNNEDVLNKIFGEFCVGK